LVGLIGFRTRFGWLIFPCMERETAWLSLFWLGGRTTKVTTKMAENGGSSSFLYSRDIVEIEKSLRRRDLIGWNATINSTHNQTSKIWANGFNFDIGNNNNFLLHFWCCLYCYWWLLIDWKNFRKISLVKRELVLKIKENLVHVISEEKLQYNLPKIACPISCKY
jgi:hypothetical protein